MKNHSALVVTSLQPGAIAGIVSDYFRRSKASVEPVEDNRDALERAQSESEPVIAVVGLAQGMFTRSTSTKARSATVWNWSPSATARSVRSGTAGATR